MSTDLTFRKYQDVSRQTSGAHQDLYGLNARLAIACLGLTGEAGEVGDYVKKVVGHGHPLDRDVVAKELGDVMWYVAEICSALQLDMSDVAGRNIEKLQARYPDGFSSERSINRAV